MPPLDKAYQVALDQYWSGASDSKGDPAHDIAHVKRVLGAALNMAGQEGADADIVRASAWFHDLVNLPKDHPDRKQASRRSAEEAAIILKNMNFPAEKIPDVMHAIEAHSYSAGVAPKTLEAKILQDADRLDALGAIGIARTFAVSGRLSRALFHPDMPLPLDRPVNDTLYGVDHFYAKLFLLPDQMHTMAGRRLARERVAFMEQFVEQLASEANP